MRLECPGCHTAHEVSGRPAGTLVTCGCGETFGFPRPAGGLIALQCPGCGASSAPAQARCAYCDTALKSVCCPNCFALMASGDAHCTRCGASVARPALTVHRHGDTTLPCPRCSTALTANLVGDHLFDRCDRCGGIWAHHLAIAGLFAERGQRYSVGAWLGQLAPPAAAAADVGAAVHCPDCERPMTRQTVKRHERLLVDCCHDHGVWFDFRELRAVVGVPRKRRRQRAARRPLEGRTNFATHLKEFDDWWPFEAIDDLLDFLEELLD